MFGPQLNCRPGWLSRTPQGIGCWRHCYRHLPVHVGSQEKPHRRLDRVIGVDECSEIGIYEIHVLSSCQKATRGGSSVVGSATAAMTGYSPDFWSQASPPRARNRWKRENGSPTESPSRVVTEFAGPPDHALPHHGHGGRPEDGWGQVSCVSQRSRPEVV